MLKSSLFFHYKHSCNHSPNKSQSINKIIKRFLLFLTLIICTINTIHFIFVQHEFSNGYECDKKSDKNKTALSIWNMHGRYFGGEEKQICLVSVAPATTSSDSVCLHLLSTLNGCDIRDTQDINVNEMKNAPTCYPVSLPVNNFADISVPCTCIYIFRLHAKQVTKTQIENYKIVEICFRFGIIVNRNL